jgi:putative transposase
MKRTALQHTTPATDAISYAGYRFPPDVIGYGFVRKGVRLL